MPPRARRRAPGGARRTARLRAACRCCRTSRRRSRKQLRSALGPGYEVRCRARPPQPPPPAIPVPVPFYEAHELAAHQRERAALRRHGALRRTATACVYRITRMPRGAPLPRNLLLNLILLVLMLVHGAVRRRRATSPGRCRTLARAADSVGRACAARTAAGARRARAARCGARLQHHAGPAASLSRQPHARARRDVARPQDAADAAAAAGGDAGGPGAAGAHRPASSTRWRAWCTRRWRCSAASMTASRCAGRHQRAARAACAASSPKWAADVTVGGRALRPLPAKPQALKRCFTNLIANAIKFGTRARRQWSQDGAGARDPRLRRGPGIPPDELERVFEPFYRAGILAQPRQRRHRARALASRAISRRRMAARSALANLPPGGPGGDVYPAAAAADDGCARGAPRTLPDAHSLTIVHRGAVPAPLGQRSQAETPKDHFPRGDC